MSLKARMARLEKATRTMAPNECACPTVRGVSGWRCAKSFERPDLAPPEAVELAERESDYVERCQVCGKKRPCWDVLYVENWAEKVGWPSMF